MTQVERIGIDERGRMRYLFKFDNMSATVSLPSDCDDPEAHWAKLAHLLKSRRP